MSAREPADGCDARWQALLALDHSRQAPWGPLHVVAFATWSLQHPRRSGSAVVARSWLVFHRLIVDGEAVERVVAELRAAGGDSPRGWSCPPLPGAAPARYSRTIESLGDFDATAYEAALWEWARATLADWRAP